MTVCAGATALVFAASTAVGTGFALSPAALRLDGQRLGCEAQRRMLVASSVESAQTSGETVSVTERRDGVVIVRHADYNEFFLCRDAVLEVHFTDPLLPLAKPAPAQR
jgi:hypothetical protein